jgi:hypothetical protein
MGMNYAAAAWHEKKIFLEDDFSKSMAIFMINTFVNPFEGGCLISCSASVHSRRPGNIATEKKYPQPGKIRQFLS